MNKIKQLLTEGPHRIGADKSPAVMASKTFDLLYTYDSENRGHEFERKGDTVKDCKERLFLVFTIIDGLVQKHNASELKAFELKKLLLLASTPVRAEQEVVLKENAVLTDTFTDIITTSEAMKIGVMSFWNE